MNYISIKLTYLKTKGLEIYNRAGVLHLQALGSILCDGRGLGLGREEREKGKGCGTDKDCPHWTIAPEMAGPSWLRGWF